jgi:hypothetical protein
MTQSAQSDDRRPWWLWATAAACVGVVAFAWSSSESVEPEPCSEAAAFMIEVWGTPARARIEARADVAADVDRIDALARTWSHERTEVCHGSQAGAESPTRWSARRRCLDRWAERFDAAVELAGASQVTVAAVASVLDSPTRCRDAIESAALPADPQRLARVLSGRSHLSRAEVWLAVGTWDAAGSELHAAREDLDASGHRPLLLEVQLWEAAIPPGSAHALMDVGAAATAVGEDTTASRALALAMLLDTQAGTPADASLASWAKAMVDRSGDEAARAWLDAAQGGDLDHARARLANALGPDHALVAGTLSPAGSTASR